MLRNWSRCDSASTRRGGVDAQEQVDHGKRSAILRHIVDRYGIGFVRSRLAKRNPNRPSATMTTPPVIHGQTGCGFPHDAREGNLVLDILQVRVAVLFEGPGDERVGLGNLNVLGSPAAALGLRVSSQVRSLTALTRSASDSTRAMDRP